jgi:F-type H+-transporting ATPase subunit gamma
MEELERLKRNIKNARELQSLVKIMKTISAVSLHEYEQAVESLIEYNKTIEMGFQIIMQNGLRDLPTFNPVKKKKRLGAVIFGSEQGLCGNFNEQIARYAIEKLNNLEHEGQIALAVGERVIGSLEEAGQPIESHFSFSGNPAGITQVMLELLLKIEEWRSEEDVDQIIIFYNGPISGSSFRPRMIYLYPLDMNWLNRLSEEEWPSRSLPTFSMNSDRLFSSLVRHYLFFSLYRAFIESLASENASRLASMQMAEKNLEEHLSELQIQFNRQRQAAITSELLDIITGFEALTGVPN